MIVYREIDGPFCGTPDGAFYLCLYPVYITIRKQNSVAQAQNLCFFMNTHLISDCKQRIVSE